MFLDTHGVDLKTWGTADKSVGLINLNLGRYIENADSVGTDLGLARYIWISDYYLSGNIYRLRTAQIIPL